LIVSKATEPTASIDMALLSQLATNVVVSQSA
jgi:hypothetical protein